MYNSIQLLHCLLFIVVFNPSIKATSTTSSTAIAPSVGVTTLSDTRLPTIISLTTPTPSPTPVVVIATVNENANLRAGPGTNYAKIGLVAKNKTVRLVRINPTNDWYQLETGEWIAAFLVDSLSGMLTPDIAATKVPSASATPTRIAPSTAIAASDPASMPVCSQPPSDVCHVQINGETVNARTLWMLQLAQHLYGGPGSILRVVQGSYEPGLKESFGTHDGGGAVDISIRNPAKLAEVLWAEAPKMVAAMRKAGFAAWYRPTGMFGPDSGAHIHAIAIGDPELSPAARRQLDGSEGYFRGLDGVPPEYSGPHPDPYGGPVICPWMLVFGFKDLR